MTVGIYSVTMSPVLNVVLFGTAESGAPFHFQAVLKLYDRRFGTSLQRHRYQHVPHTAEREADFQAFVRQGRMDYFLKKQEEEEEEEDEEEEEEGEEQDEDNVKPQSPLDPQPQHFPKEPPNPEPTAKFEAALWKECQDNFTGETEAYNRLQDLQGKSISPTHPATY
ncbi:hypothetical protein C8A01DRAFT_41469 [Parachaetomium inaequale]|uniref:Uncharacterized protein n=1 Tax=Parachaetomium inaequale TaxID=2588326 RepID=A0AAN6P771_9PEZI|nr:hypothetical protein C8A01DRAFT_41469 [Parachaetomium inaequale]